jgi:ABC-type histidine transport system ATPase subunit
MVNYFSMLRQLQLPSLERRKRTLDRMLTPRENQLLEKLADEGKPTKLVADEIKIARELASIDLVFIARDAEETEPIYAVTTPKGRKAPSQLADLTKKKPPLGFLG